MASGYAADISAAEQPAVPTEEEKQLQPAEVLPPSKLLRYWAFRSRSLQSVSSVQGEHDALFETVLRHLGAYVEPLAGHLDERTERRPSQQPSRRAQWLDRLVSSSEDKEPLLQQLSSQKPKSGVLWLTQSPTQEFLSDLNAQRPKLFPHKQEAESHNALLDSILGTTDRQQKPESKAADSPETVWLRWAPSPWLRGWSNGHYLLLTAHPGMQSKTRDLLKRLESDEQSIHERRAARDELERLWQPLITLLKRHVTEGRQQHAREKKLKTDAFNAVEELEHLLTLAWQSQQRQREESLRHRKIRSPKERFNRYKTLRAVDEQTNVLRRQLKKQAYATVIQDAPAVLEQLMSAWLPVFPSPEHEIRGLWLDRSTLVELGSEKALAAYLEELKRLGMSDIFVETLNAGFPIYDSQVLPQTNPLLEGWDPLAVSVRVGHQLGLRIHAWTWVFAVGNTRHNKLIDKPPSYQGPILSQSRYRRAAMLMSTGGLLPPKQHEYWLSPAKPVTRELLLSFYKELLSRYDVDGVQLDYIRYPFQKPAFNAGGESALQYARETARGTDGLTYYNPTWQRWKSQQIDRFVKEVSVQLHAQKPELILSAAVFPFSQAKRRAMIQQEWEHWLANDWVDWLIPMLYTDSPSLLASQLESIHRKALPHKALVIPGLSLSRPSEGRALELLWTARRWGSVGHCYFAAAHLKPPLTHWLEKGPYQADPNIGLYTLADWLTSYRELLKQLRTLNKDKGLPVAVSQSHEALLDELQAPHAVEMVIQHWKQFHKVANEAVSKERLPEWQDSYLREQLEQLEQRLVNGLKRQYPTLVQKKPLPGLQDSNGSKSQEASLQANRQASEAISPQEAHTMMQSLPVSKRPEQPTDNEQSSSTTVHPESKTKSLSPTAKQPQKTEFFLKRLLKHW